MFTPGSSPRHEPTYRQPVGGMLSPPKTPKIKVFDPTQWDPVDHGVHVREVHAGFIARTEANIQELQRYVTVSENAKKHMYELLEGDMTLPWILLQNPKYTQDFATFDEMVSRTKTLYLLEEWLQKRNPNLSLRNMPIMDVFPLVDDDKLIGLPVHEREIATGIVFRITMDLIWTYKPPKIILMQCYSKGGDYSKGRSYNDWIRVRGRFRHQFATDICSDTTKALHPEILHGRTLWKSVAYRHLDDRDDEKYSFHVVMSRHPAGIGRYNLRNASADTATVIDLLDRQYGTHTNAYPSSDSQGDGSLQSCYLRVSEEKKRRARALSGNGPPSGQLLSLNDEEIRALCLQGMQIPGGTNDSKSSLAAPITPLYQAQYSKETTGNDLAVQEPLPGPQLNTTRMPETPSPTPQKPQVESSIQKPSVPSLSPAETPSGPERQAPAELTFRPDTRRSLFNLGLPAQTASHAPSMPPPGPTESQDQVIDRIGRLSLNSNGSAAQHAQPAQPAQGSESSPEPEKKNILQELKQNDVDTQKTSPERDESPADDGAASDAQMPMQKKESRSSMSTFQAPSTQPARSAPLRSEMIEKINPSNDSEDITRRLANIGLSIDRMSPKAEEPRAPLRLSQGINPALDDGAPAARASGDIASVELPSAGTGQVTISDLNQHQEEAANLYVARLAGQTFKLSQSLDPVFDNDHQHHMKPSTRPVTRSQARQAEAEEDRNRKQMPPGDDLASKPASAAKVEVLSTDKGVAKAGVASTTERLELLEQPDALEKALIDILHAHGRSPKALSHAVVENKAGSTLAPTLPTAATVVKVEEVAPEAAAPA